MIALEVNGRFLDLYENEKIVQSFSLINIADITKRESEYSNEFKIPKTTNNLEIFEYADYLNNNTNITYARINCNIYVVGLLFKIGFISISSIDDDISVRYFTGNALFYDTIKQKSINQIDTVKTPSLKTIWNLTNVVNLRGASEGIFFPMVDYNGMPTASTTVDIRLLLPSFYRKTLMEAICEDAGYTLINNINTESLDAYNHDIIPTATNKLTNDAESITVNSYEAKAGYSVSQAYQRAYNLYQYQTFDISFYISNKIYYNFSDFVSGTETNYFGSSGNYQSYFVANVEGEYDVTLNGLVGYIDKQTWFYDNQYTADKVPKFTANYKIEWWATVNNIETTLIHTTTQGYTNHAEINNGTGKLNVVWTDTFNQTAKVKMNKGDKLKILSKPKTTFSKVDEDDYWGVDMISDFNIQINQNALFEATPTSGLTFGTLVSPNNCLTGIKQSDFFKDTLVRYCLIPVINEQNKTVTLQSFTDIKNNIENSLDWSDKLDQTKDVQITYRIDSYGQRNLVNHKEDKFVLSPPNEANGVITIPDENLKLENKLYESPFAASPTVDRLNGKKVISIDLHDGVDLLTAKRFKNDVSPRTCYTRKENFSVSYTDGVSTTIVNTDIPLTWFIDYTQPYSAGFQSNLLDYSTDMISILNRLKLVTVELRLNIIDILNLSYLKPIYINDLNSYFILSGVKQFDYTTTESTTVELIKLN